MKLRQRSQEMYWLWKSWMYNRIKSILGVCKFLIVQCSVYIVCWSHAVRVSNEYAEQVQWTSYWLVLLRCLRQRKWRWFLGWNLPNCVCLTSTCFLNLKLMPFDIELRLSGISRVSTVPRDISLMSNFPDWFTLVFLAAHHPQRYVSKLWAFVLLPFWIELLWHENCLNCSPSTRDSRSLVPDQIICWAHLSH